jgi:hypothetical protein
VSIASLPKSSTRKTTCKSCKEHLKTISQLKTENHKLNEKIKELNKKLANDSGKSTNSRHQKYAECFRMSVDTSTYLRSFENNHFAKKLLSCKDGLNLELDGIIETVNSELEKGCVQLAIDCFDKQTATHDHVERTKWKTRLYNLIESVYQTRFGEIVFHNIKEGVAQLLKNYATVSDATNVENTEVIEIPGDFDL